MSEQPRESLPRILMVIPTLGERPEYLRETLESIRKQKDVLFDIVMIFPLDNQETMNLAKEFDALTVQDPGGISAAVNVGIAQAKSHHEYIGWLGDDDLLSENSLNIAQAGLDNNPEALLAFGFCDYIDEKGDLIFTNHAGWYAPWLMTWGPNLVPCPGTLFRKSALVQAGTFDEQLKYCMDLDMLLRLRKMGKFYNTRTTLASFRWHSTSTTVLNRGGQLEEVKQVKRKHLSKTLRFFVPLWEPPVRFATRLAAQQVEKKASKLQSNSA